MNLEKIIFIGGSGRCGSTLISELLDKHSKLAAIFEVHPFIYLLKNIKLQQIPGKAGLEKQYDSIREALQESTEYNWRLTEKEAIRSWDKLVIDPISEGKSILEVTKNWINYIHKIQTIRDGSKFIIHKTPALSSYLPQLKLLFPESYFLHIIRNPVDVIASYLKQSWGPNKIEEGVKWYCERVGEALFQGLYFPNYIEISFEDLIQNPSGILDLIQFSFGLENETKDILNSGLIDTGKIINRRAAFNLTEINMILNAVNKQLPSIYFSYANEFENSLDDKNRKDK